VLTRKLGAEFGIVISASHNPYYDNGIKFFGPDGEKLSDALEQRIEDHIDDSPTTCDSSELGRATNASFARDDYINFCLTTVPEGLRLDGLKIVVDASHGAGYKVAPHVISALGADVVPVGCSPNGRNINDGCGSTRPDLLRLTVTGVRASVGFALDGDGDRVVMVDENGSLLDGDQLLYVLARDRLESGILRGPVVGTVMSNLGLQFALEELGVPFMRAQVGDRHVLAMLKQHGGILGGETSGHLLCLDKMTTGDGLVAALQVLAVMRRTGKPLSELAASMSLFPQVLVNVRTPVRIDPLEMPAIRGSIADVESALAGRGRVVLRASGTEPVIRVMVEGENHEEVSAHAARLADSVRASVS
jgi:phosphoglucosamine mutase